MGGYNPWTLSYDFNIEIKFELTH